MLDQETKKRIDDCRDILVGKVPDPKSQVEQITIALIYKFMDDMDRQSIEMGGKASFFSGDYKKYSWTAIFDPRVGGHDLLKLYSEAIEGMNQNPKIPQLFRNIFNNAYLPYRDPETLKLFLKEINNFEYSHSEKLGDAFEYLLSFMGTQGDAGQFRTPRHIIDFIAEVVDPKKTETILDPACGTAGFLISAYKHILKTNDNGKKLTPTERKRLLTNFSGYDISPDMVRLSLVNLYLHGFQDPKIYEYDTLTSEERWDETVDVILANPPFMTPTGGIRPHKRFSMQAKRSEVLFVDYIAEHLNPGGRAGVIVPEGIIFQSSNAYKTLRKMLVENYIWAVVSLPAGVFQPYSGVKTSILLMDKTKAKQSDSILFIKVDNDGFDLGTQRRTIDKNDLPEALGILESGDVDNTEMAHWVEKSKIEESGDWNLSGERYRIRDEVQMSNYEMVELVEVCLIKTGKKDVNQGNPNGVYPFFTCAKEHTYSDEYSFDTEALLIAGNGDVGAIKYFKGKFEAYQRTYVLSKFVNALPKYLYYVLKIQLKETVSQQKQGNTMPYIKLGMLQHYQTPLPPLSVQEEIVAEIDGYQKIIDGARQVVENYKPTIKIDPEWEMVELGEICEFENGDRGKNYPNKSEYVSDGIPWINTGHILPDGSLSSELMNYITKEKYDSLRSGKIKKGDLVYCLRGATIGKTALVGEYSIGAVASSLVIIRPGELLNEKFAYFFLTSPLGQEQIKKYWNGAAQPNLGAKSVAKYIIPKPSITEQTEIVAQIEAEQEMVNANNKLIEIYEQKIKDMIGEVWGE